MALQVLEGTWEEISQHAAELTGKSLQLTILSEPPSEEARLINVTAPHEEVRASLRKIMARQVGVRETDQYRLSLPGNDE